MSKYPPKKTSIQIDDEFVQFVRAVRNEPSLWYPDDPNFGNHGQKLSIWEQIAHKFRMSVDRTKQRFKSIRDRYRKKIKMGLPVTGRERIFMRELKFLDQAGRRFRNPDRLEQNSLSYKVESADNSADGNGIYYGEDNSDMKMGDEDDDDDEEDDGTNWNGLCEVNVEEVKQEVVSDGDDDVLIEPGPTTYQHPKYIQKSKTLQTLRSAMAGESLLEKELSRNNSTPNTSFRTRSNVTSSTTPMKLRNNYNQEPVEHNLPDSEVKQITLGIFIDQMIEQEPEETRELFSVDILDAVVKIKRQYAVDRSKKHKHDVDFE